MFNRSASADAADATGAWLTRQLLRTTMRRSLVSAQIVALCRLCSASSLQAQQAQQAPSRPSGTVADSLAHVTTDTGALAPGHKTFTRYETPGMCLAGAWNARDIAQRAINTRMWRMLDSLHAIEDPSARGDSGRITRDTLPTAAITVARTCGARFSVNTVPTGQLLDYLQLALVAQNDTLARNIVTRWLDQARTPAARDSAWQLGLGAYLAAKPARIAASEALVAQLDTSSRDAMASRMSGHGIILRFAAGRFDRALMRREAVRILTISETLDDVALKAARVSIPWDHEALARLLEIAYVDTPDSLTAIATRWKPLLSRPVSDVEHRASDIAAMTPSALATFLLSFSHLPLGQPNEAFDFPQAAYSYAAPNASSDTTGRVTLRVVTSTDLGNDLVYGWEWTELYSHIKQWHERYGNRLSIVIVCQAGGYWGTGTDGTGPMSFQQESRRARALFQEYLKLPVQVAVFVGEIKVQPDGRRLIQPALPDLAMINRNAGPVVLTDARGRLQYRGELTPLFEALLDRTMRDGTVRDRSMGDSSSTTHGSQ